MSRWQPASSPNSEARQSSPAAAPYGVPGDEKARRHKASHGELQEVLLPTDAIEETAPLSTPSVGRKSVAAEELTFDDRDKSTLESCDGKTQGKLSLLSMERSCFAMDPRESPRLSPWMTR